MQYCEETVKIWIDNNKEKLSNLSEEIDDIQGTISNERLWLKGS